MLNKKKLLAAIMAATVVTSSIPYSAFAEEATEVANDDNSQITVEETDNINDSITNEQEDNAKAVPQYEVPDLQATEGQTLKDVPLPEGFTWDDDTLSVGKAGTNTFKATYTPDDINNYEVVADIDVPVKVSKKVDTNSNTGTNGNGSNGNNGSNSNGSNGNRTNSSGHPTTKTGDEAAPLMLGGLLLGSGTLLGIFRRKKNN